MPGKRNKKSATFYNFYVATKNPKKPRNFLKIGFILLLCILLVFVLIFFRIKKASSGEKFNKFAYLVVVGEFAKSSDAKDYSDTVEKSGGAGYVWIDDNYSVVAFVYPTLFKAESVLKNLEETPWKASIKKIALKKPNAPKGAQKSAVDFIWSQMTELYNLSIKFDKGEATEAPIYKKLSKTELDISLIINNLGSDNFKLKSRLESLKNNIEKFLKSFYKSNIYASGLKNLCVDFVYAAFNLYNDIE